MYILGGGCLGYVRMGPCLFVYHPQENECGVVPCVVLCDFDFQGFKVNMGYVVNIANVCYGIYGWDWGLGFRVWVVLVHMLSVVLCVVWIVVVVVWGGGRVFVIWVVYVILVWCR